MSFGSELPADEILPPPHSCHRMNMRSGCHLVRTLLSLYWRFLLWTNAVVLQGTKHSLSHTSPAFDCCFSSNAGGGANREQPLEILSTSRLDSSGSVFGGNILTLLREPSFLTSHMKQHRFTIWIVSHAEAQHTLSLLG
mmetsp:Transcript_53449/g.97770  ORF Transcript_53449/g.97770 Transcript_53449/m.97770 type:complete len:139 (-) Transcript_53449:71-487(-)